jgi:hypothetical protein
VPQFVGIAHDIDADDLATVNLERSGLMYVALLDGDEPRQPIDQPVAYQARSAPDEGGALV